MRSCCVCAERLSLAIYGCSEIWHFECSDVIEVCDGVIFNFYMGLLHLLKSQYCNIGNMQKLYARDVLVCKYMQVRKLK